MTGKLDIKTHEGHIYFDHVQRVGMAMISREAMVEVIKEIDKLLDEGDYFEDQDEREFWLQTRIFLNRRLATTQRLREEWGLFHV